MQLYPAIDLLDGQVVRLRKGDFAAVTVYNPDPLAQAREFAQAGARWLHVVDLDATRAAGRQNNRELISRIIVESGLSVQVGGGIRSLAAIEALARAGASRVVLGTTLITDESLVDEAIDSFGDLICAAIDARNGKVAIAGWLQTSSVSALDLAADLAERGLRHFLYTDINRDGLQTGIDVAAYRQLAEVCGCPVIASGGVATLDDLYALQAIDDCIEAVIVGRALYEHSFTVEQALAVIAEGDLDE